MVFLQGIIIDNMSKILKLEQNIKSIIDDLKALCNEYGLSNQASEEEIITSIFLYKFLNDKFLYEIKLFSNALNSSVQDVLLNKDNALDNFYNNNPNSVMFKYDDTINYLLKYISNDNFYQIFDDTLVRISSYPENKQFQINNVDGQETLLFNRISESITFNKRNDFVQSLFRIISKDHFEFADLFVDNFDFYSVIFEYLINDYNVASGVYAEYFTPQVLSKIISKILVNMSPVENNICDIYDPSAGSGSLVLHLANELGINENCNEFHIYTQDISSKSSRLLRINMLLNGLTENLDNLVEGDTLVNPAHFNVKNDSSSGLKRFDYIISNPPFKVDFSSRRNLIESNWSKTSRFFAGVPNIPQKDKSSMAIYLLFIQHILYSLKENGKAAIVVPTGFLTINRGISFNIRKKLIDSNILKGVISMPSKLFANTTINVSILFLDSGNKDSQVFLMDATSLGTKLNDGNNQRVVLSDNEIELIENSFIERNEIDNFSVLTIFDQIKDNDYSFLAGQYFKVKMDSEEFTQNEFENQMNIYKSNLRKYFAESKVLEKKIENGLENLKYDSL